ncbi:MAG: hypothetical protein J6T04_05735 [Bacteroidales bacterium]|nr:hypothetical protein [Bacteroidales bacterium]
MFKEGSILYFKPFYFKNGAEPKNKYFIVLKNIEDNLLLASLPTSKDHIPSDMTIKFGRCEIREKGVSAFVFMGGKDIATEPSSTNRFSFPQNTFIYGEQLDTFPLSTIRKQIESKVTKVTLVGILDSDILDDIIGFIKQSCTVKGRFKKML